MKIIYYLVRYVYEAVSLPFLFFALWAARLFRKPVEVGLGPFPLINNIYHKRALLHAGYTAETFVNQVWHITSDFDVRFDTHWLSRNILTKKFLLNFYILIWSVWRYRAIIMYFDGGPLGQGTAFLWRLEPYLYRLGGVKTIILPYGSDVQVMSRSHNLQFKHAMSVDYPQHRMRHRHIREMIDIWTSSASHIVGGCEWVDYMHHWDTLMIAHFSISLPDITSVTLSHNNQKMKVLHAPNHREIKGTRHLIRAVEELSQEGINIELIMAERMPNEKVRKLIYEADVIVDQLVIGWYAMFAIEAMSSNKPVICHLRNDLESLYVATGLLEGFDEIPIIKADVFSIKSILKEVYYDRTILDKAAEKGRGYVQRHHSIEAISFIFDKILSQLIAHH